MNTGGTIQAEVTRFVEYKRREGEFARQTEANLLKSFLALLVTSFGRQRPGDA